MAVKSRYNLVSSKSEYSRYYSMFRGVDLSQNATDIESYRFSDAINVWKDPEAAQGGAVETFPGFRRLHTFPGKINGIHEWVGLDGVRRIAVHAGTHLYVFLHEERDLLHDQEKITLFPTDVFFLITEVFSFSHDIHIKWLCTSLILIPILIPP